MPPLFTRLLAERLDTLTPLSVGEGVEGETPVPGRPAVDALFGSLAEIYGPAIVAAVLTGMGHDGTAGAQRLAARGSYIVAQDEATSVVWGMPGAVVDAGVANEILPLEDVVPAILREVDCP